MTLVAGLVGSVIGGALLDKLKSRVPSDSPDHFFLKPTMKLLMWCSLLAWPFSTAAFLFDSIAMFCVFVFIAEFIIFLSMGPANNAILWYVYYVMAVLFWLCFVCILVDCIGLYLTQRERDCGAFGCVCMRVCACAKLNLFVSLFCVGF